jgi:hydrogenase maturation protease
MNTLIFGLGNPYRGDDSIGIKVAGELKSKFRKENSLEIKNGNIGIFSLLELSKDYKRLIIIDAIVKSNREAGKIEFLDLSDLDIKGFFLPHFIGLRTAWSLWQERFKYPEVVEVIAINIKNEIAYKDSLSPSLQCKLPEIIKTISNNLKLKPKPNSAI